MKQQGFRLKSLNNLVLLIGFGTLTVFSGIFVIANYLIERNVTDLTLHQSCETVAKRLAENLLLPMWNYDIPNVQANILAEVKGDDIRSITVTEERGHLVAWACRFGDSRIETGTMMMPAESILPSIYQEYSVRFNSKGKFLGILKVTVSDEFRMKDFATRMLFAVSVQFALILFAMVVFMVSMRLLILRRITNLTHIVTGFSASGFEMRAIVSRNDEIGQLATNFNYMAQTISEYSREMENLVQERTSQLVEAEKLAFLGSLVAGFAHEINTPVGVALTAVTYLESMIQTLESKYAAGTITRLDMDELLADFKESSALINSNLNRTSKLVQILKGAGVDLMSEECIRFDLRSYIDDLLITMRTRLAETGHQVRVDIDPGIHLFTSPDAIQQIMGTLINNAMVHAYPEDRQGIIEIAARKTDNGVVMTCRDFGVGMSSELMQRVFTPFFTTRRGHGSIGLGLYLVYVMIKKLDGTISCINAEGGGLLFTITLPASLLAPI